MISGLALLATQPLHAHPMSFNSTMSYSSSQPSGGTDSIANWTGAAFDAANVGGSGVNADGGADNGTANDTSTYVVDNGTAQGQTFTTGSNVNGYEFTSVTVRMAGYTNNTATGSNVTSWNLNPTNGPIIVTVGKISGTTHLPISQQNFMAGGTGHPGSGSSANGSGTYLTFTLPFPVHLDPNTTYSFDLTIARSANSFEMLGTNADPYASGAAFTRSGTTITPRSGDRVFQANLTASTAAPTLFTHRRKSAQARSHGKAVTTCFSPALTRRPAGRPTTSTGSSAATPATTTPARSKTRRRSISSPCAGNSPVTPPTRTGRSRSPTSGRT
jgi:hypothetical protein